MYAKWLAFCLAIIATCALAGATASGLGTGWIAACAAASGLRTGWIAACAAAGWGLSAAWLAACA